VMSSASSAVTYTSVYTDSELGRAFCGVDDEEISEGGIPRVIVYRYDRLPIQPVAPPLLDYIPGPEDPQTPPEDEHEFPAEEQPLPPVDSPTAESPGYVTESDPEEDPEECTAPPVHSSPLPVPSPLLPSSGCPTQIQTPRITSTHALIDAVITALPSPPLPPSLYIPPPVDRRDDIPESEQPPRKRLYLSTLGSRYEVGESSTARPTRDRGIDYGFVSMVDAEERRQGTRDVGYGIRDTWVDPAKAVPKIAPMTVGEVNTRVTEIAELHEHDIQDLDMRREMSDMQAELLALREQQRRARQPGPDARIPDHQDASRDTDSHIQLGGQIMAPTTRRGPNTPVNNTNPNNMTPESIQAMIDLSFAKLHQWRWKPHRGVVMTRWIEKMELVFNISGCAIENQVKFATCTLLGAALTWWNDQIRTLGPEAYAMTWERYSKKDDDKYLSSSGLPDNIYGNVKSARPKTLDETIELASDLMDQKLCTYAERQSDNKRKADDSSRNNHGDRRKEDLWGIFAQVHQVPSSPQWPVHLEVPQKGNGATPKGKGCFECGAPGHFKRDCPKLKSKDGGNENAQGWVYAVGNAEKRGNAAGNPDANVVTGTFLLNNHCASILFDIGADRSFISTTFSSLINIAPTPLENCYDVELADGKLVRIDTIIRGCTLNFLDHLFNIDLMPVELGSFDVIIRMY
ncbi:putative reverse transcriptase domain-containing protein, partial [Tanacetum coccineum]